MASVLMLLTSTGACGQRNTSDNWGEVVGHRSHPSSITVPILPLSRTSKPGDTDKTITIS